MPKFEWRPWAVLGVFSLLQALITVSIYTALGIALPAMVKDQAWTWTEAEMGFTVIGVCIGGSSYVPTILIRRFGVRATLLLGSVCVACGLAVLGLVHSLVMYFLGAALCGVGYQMMALIPANHVLTNLFRRKSSVLGLYFTLSSALSAAGPLTIIAMLRLFHNDWRRLWEMEALVALAIGSACALVTGGRAWMERAAAALEARIAEEAAKPAGTKRAAGHRTQETWTLAEAARTPQFYILMAAYFGHVICLATTAGATTAHLTQRGVSLEVVGIVLTIEALAGMAWRLLAGILGDLFDARYLLIFALGALVIGMYALAVARGYPSMLVFAVGTGIGFTVTPLAVMVLVPNYFGRKHNLEIFSTICLVGAASALGPTIGGVLRDRSGSFSSTFELYALLNAAAFLAALFMRPPRRKSPQAPKKSMSSNPLMAEAANLADTA
jgi:MFS family permease